MSKSWDSGILKKLKSLVGKGLSTAEIGKKLGISKNAVVGKLHRMGWNSGATETPATKKSTKTTKNETKSVKKNAVKKPVAKVTEKKSAKAETKTVKKTVKAKTETVKTEIAKKEEKTVAAVKPVAQKPDASSKKNLTVHQRIIQHSLEMMDLKPGQCRWPMGDPDSENFHFCGKQAFVGKPYCYEHCKQAYQFNAPKKKQ